MSCIVGSKHFYCEVLSYKTTFLPVSLVLSMFTCRFVMCRHVVLCCIFVGMSTCNHACVFAIAVFVFDLDIYHFLNTIDNPTDAGWKLFRVCGGGIRIKLRVLGIN